MKVGVVGTGGVGGYFGGLIAMSGNVDIHFLARGKHLQVIEEEGLTVVSNDKSTTVFVHATSEPQDIGYVDLILFCVKSYDTEYTARFMEPMVGPDTVILTLQNGLDNVDKLAQFYDLSQIMAGTTYIESRVASPGVIVHRGHPGRIVFGELNGEITERAKKILDMFIKAKIEAVLSDHIYQVLWEKFLLICAIHGVCTVSRSSIGQVLACEETRELLKGVMEEVKKIAFLKDVGLPDDIVDRSVIIAESYDGAFKPSMLRDLEWKQPLEVDALNGLVVKMGRELGVSTPLNFAIYATLKLEDLKIQNPYWASVVEKR
ncbi:MAG: 2-dehydropantoate 2-reductase [Syntrophobacterales bacterium]|nr:2-dehydropantoate 2-reductase [Syntrophobacterales bacterium]